MGYSYDVQRGKVFTEAGQVLFRPGPPPRRIPRFLHPLRAGRGHPRRDRDVERRESY